MNDRLTDLLNNSNLLKTACFVGGEWLQAQNSDDIIHVHNPFNDSVIGCVPNLSSKDINSAIDHANIAQADWANRTAHERGEILQHWADLIDNNADDLAIIMTAESGKTIKESRGEIDYAISFIRFFAEEGKRTYGDVIPTTKNKLRYVITKQPIGVCAAITPWNFPSAMITRKVAPALAVGCTIIVKPASQTPFSALALAYLADKAGLPKGVLQIVTGKADIISDTLCKSPIVKKLSFTGSTQTGRILMAKCANTIKKLSLELGGDAPFIVFDDANLDQAVDGLIASKHRNAGQTCVCANRVYLHKAIKDEFIKRYTNKVTALKVGDGMDKTVDIGSLINQDALNKTQSLLQDALKKGATLITGGKTADVGKLTFMPTIITDISDKMDIAKAEIFAPITAIYEFEDEQDVINRANDTIVGLAAYFYTNDLARSWRVMEGLDYGMVGQNTGMISNAVAPFGGVKQSGFGREGSKYGIDEYLTIKYWCVGIND